MVTAIVIPIICIYFFWLTKKEMKEHDIKWLATGQVPQEAIVQGKITSMFDEKQRFYYNRYIYVQELKLQTETKLITVKKVSPITHDMKIVPFQLGEEIRVYGRWQDQQFYCANFEKVDRTNQRER
ncbi:hypothetical protein [Neobacillus sp. PS3-40]|uniref:hypothetical protein n=1 Tax=Neobacillus sp. PS3-40 TaxID=3070679 RepID=UPI0027DFBC9C|nr:hypothetical protein [Neobacillus sp. PS3-40]WML43578.1 hypothetical protein RCG20_17555 [Neobacillus sp. PS3-40]